MARTALTITELPPEAVTAAVLTTLGTAIDATNSHVITPTGDITPDELVLFIVHTTAAQKTVTVKAGANPPAVRNGAGDLVATMADGSVTNTLAFVPLGGGSRFMQADGTINVDIAAATTGRIGVYRVSRDS